MKKRSLTLITILFSLCLIIFACRRELNNLVNDQVVSSQTLSSAKIYHANNARKVKTLDGRPFKTLRPLWNDSWSLETDSGEILVVPTIESKVDNNKLEARRVFVFSSKNNQTQDGKILEIIGKDYDVTKNLNLLISKYKEKKIQGFTGSILQYDINYFFAKGGEFKDGVKTDRKAVLYGTLPTEDRPLSRNSNTKANTRGASGALLASGPWDGYVFNPNCNYLLSYDSDGILEDIQPLTCSSPVGSGSGSGSGEDTPWGGNGPDMILRINNAKLCGTINSQWFGEPRKGYTGSMAGLGFTVTKIRTYENPQTAIISCGTVCFTSNLGSSYNAEEHLKNAYQLSVTQIMNSITPETTLNQTYLDIEFRAAIKLNFEALTGSTLSFGNCLFAPGKTFPMNSAKYNCK